MKTINYITGLFLLLGLSSGFSQGNLPITQTRKLTIEPAVGIHTNFGTDLLLTNLLQWNPHKRVSFGAHTSFNINNPLMRDFNFVRTNYNYSLNQKFGIGTSLYSRKSTHTFFLMGGISYTSYEEILVNPNFNSAGVSIDAVSPDYGLMYSFKRGWKKYFFTSRVYLPLYPWPTKSVNIAYIDGNLNSISLECGVGIKLK